MVTGHWQIIGKLGRSVCLGREAITPKEQLQVRVSILVVICFFVGAAWLVVAIVLWLWS